MPLSVGAVTFALNKQPCHSTVISSNNRHLHKTRLTGGPQHTASSLAGNPAWMLHLGSQSARAWAAQEVLTQKWHTHPWAVCWKLAMYYVLRRGFPCGLDGKECACIVEDPGLIPGPRRPPGERNSYPFQYFCWRIPWTEFHQNGAWWTTVWGVSKSPTWMND